jgi:cytochrome c553
MTWKYASCCLLVMLLVGGAAPAAEPATAAAPVRLLFAGSSSTYWNDMPAEIARVVSGRVADFGGRPATAEIVGRSGSDIRAYSEPGFHRYEYGVKPGQTFLDKVRDERFDLVTLMVVCRFITGDGDPAGTGQAHADAVTRYCAAIRAAGSEPVFYEMGWGTTDREAEGRKRIFELAVKNGVRRFAPCSSAWDRVRRERPDLALQHPDDASHPGDLGHFLNLACFYAALTRTSPVGQLPKTFSVWPHFTKAEKERRRAELEAAFERFKPSAYQARLPEWMRRNAAAGLEATVDDGTARYLETVAWETWQSIDRRLDEALAGENKPTSNAVAVAATAAEVRKHADFTHFETKIRPVLIKHCYECHGEKKQSGGLRLDSKAGWTVGGDSGPTIEPGKPDESLLILAMSYDGLEMPPKGRLPAEIVQDFVVWVKAGAPDPRDDGPAVVKKGIDVEAGRKHWAFQPVRAVDPPAVADASWPASAIDRFVLAKLEAAGLRPSPEAPPAALVRRLYYDLTGLPPSEADVAEFAADASPSTYAALVDRLLTSPEFGEKWGRHWLDVVRYADSNGSSFNPPFYDAWRYRNWVIEQFNADAPFDRFVMRQIAGDLMPYESQAERDGNLVATGYLMLGSKVLGLFDKEALQMDVVDEQVDTIGKSLLGMTLGCARCHDHKFDPIPQRDYYAIAGIFTSTVTLIDRIGSPLDDESDWSRRGLGPQGDAKWKAFWANHRYEWATAIKNAYQARRKIAELEGKRKRSDYDRRQDPVADDLKKYRRQLAEAEAKLAEFDKQLPPLAMAPAEADEPADTELRIRGVAASCAEAVPRGFLQVASFARQPEVNRKQSGRLELAMWIADERNPLTARVWVNRVWKHLFREGIVRSTDNFGTTGELPTHPELLDHLAARFMADGWSTKRIVREIVLSRAYRQTTRLEVESAAVDPDNRLLWRQNRRRLEPEELRDTMLLFARRLDPSPSREMVNHFPLGDIGNDPAVFKLGDDRRTVYQPIIRNIEPDVLAIFDFANTSMVTGERARTTVAPQALYFLNSPAVHEAAASIAARWMNEVRRDDAAAFVRLAFRRLTGRPPTAAEVATLDRYFAAQYEGPPGPTDHDAMKLVQAILASTQFQFVD